MARTNKTTLAQKERVEKIKKDPKAYAAKLLGTLRLAWDALAVNDDTFLNSFFEDYFHGEYPLFRNYLEQADFEKISDEAIEILVIWEERKLDKLKRDAGCPV